jgi:DNA-binding NarL/FixJ family response regulator
MTRVLIADDHALFRAGLRQFLVDALPSAEIGEAASGNETLTCLQRKGWELLLLDINMPDRTGLDILRHVKSGHPATRVLVLSGYPERQYALNVLRAGAAGYIAKDAAPELLYEVPKVDKKAVKTRLEILPDQRTVVTVHGETVPGVVVKPEQVSVTVREATLDDVEPL